MLAACGLLPYVRGVDPSAKVAPAPRITVAVLLYNAAGEVPGLLESLARQRRPGFESQSGWLGAVLVDDASRDGTLDAARAALAGLGHPPHYRLVSHARNLGLAATLNELFTDVQTPYLLTCHLDCRFGSEGYVAGMLELMERHADAAAITGQPTLPRGARLPFAEKLNVVANLMDVVPGTTEAELEPVGFAEGRCDVFRVEALRAVGLYDTHLRVSGEDQVLAARLWAKGYSIYKAPRLEYQLSVSGEQDSVGKLLRHQRLFGRTTPYILLAVPGSVAGLVGSHAGANRTRRALLRSIQTRRQRCVRARRVGARRVLAGVVLGSAARPGGRGEAGVAGASRAGRLHSRRASGCASCCSSRRSTSRTRPDSSRASAGSPSVAPGRSTDVERGRGRSAPEAQSCRFVS